MTIVERRRISSLRFLAGVFSATFQHPIWLVVLGTIGAAISFAVASLFDQVFIPSTWGWFALGIAGLIFVALPLYALVAILWHRIILWGNQRSLRVLFRRPPLLRYWLGLLLAFLIGLPIIVVASILESWFRTLSLDILRLDQGSTIMLGLSVFVGQWAAPLLPAIFMPLAGLFLPGVAVGRPIRFRTAMKSAIHVAVPAAFAVTAIFVLHFGLKLALEIIVARNANPLGTSIYGELIIQVTASFLLLTVMTEAWRVTSDQTPDPPAPHVHSDTFE